MVESLGQFIMYLLNDHKIERSALTPTLMTIKTLQRDILVLMLMHKCLHATQTWDCRDYNSETLGIFWLNV